MTTQQLKKWQYIPQNAFLFFPKGDQIKTGEGETAWRKIFQQGSPYDKFEENKLLELQQYIAKNKINIDQSYINKANKLRYIQANKFDIKKASQSMEQYTIWRKQSYPIRINSQHYRLLNSGAVYFCGRDNQYRPIIVINLQKFNSDDKTLIPQVLVLVMEFMLNQLLIEGQIQNYILIINLSAYSFSLQSCVSQILSFTSNSYRGRLFANYLLQMPTLLNWGWQTFASKFVSQNTLKKIKVSKTLTHDQMWKHINKSSIQIKYGGTMPNINSYEWPPNKSLFNKQQLNNIQLISIKEYNQFYKSGKLLNRKINIDLIEKQKKIQSKIKQKQNSSLILEKSGNQLWELIKKQKIMKQTIYNYQVQTINTFFNKSKYIKIGNKYKK